MIVTDVESERKKEVTQLLEKEIKKEGRRRKERRKKKEILSICGYCSLIIILQVFQKSLMRNITAV